MVWIKDSAWAREVHKEVSEDGHEKVAMPGNEKSCLRAQALAPVCELCQLLRRGDVQEGT